MIKTIAVVLFDGLVGIGCWLEMGLDHAQLVELGHVFVYQHMFLVLETGLSMIELLKKKHKTKKLGDFKYVLDVSMLCSSGE